MKILARGEKIRTEELKQKLSSVDCDLVCVDEHELVPANVQEFDLFFDLAFDELPGRLIDYASLQGKPIIVSSVRTQLAQAVHDFGKEVKCSLYGMNALPTFINRNLVEISMLHDTDHSSLEKVMLDLKWNHQVVEDRVGMVTPRIIFMIINEACYTVMEGTAGMKDIDTAMKLGTNYPFGPFEWADKIGIRHVYSTLEAVYNDTHDERYKICPLLKTKFLKGESFYG